MPTMSDARELTITRMFDAPRELVFRCWTEPDHLAKWFGPTGFTASSITANVGEGGAWRICIHETSTGRDIWSSGVYLAVEPPERLVFSFAWDTEPGEPAEDTLVTITFADRDGKTEMTFQQSGFLTDASRDGHEGGWRETFDDLATYLRSTQMTTTELPQGDPRLLDTEIARGLLASAIPARLAFVAKDGTPRVTPVNFHWNGTELVMAGFAPSLKAKALRANPSVAITIDTDAQPPHVLLIRGRAEVTDVDGLVPEYELAMRKGVPAEQVDPYLEQLRELRPRMERITVRPAWVGVMDFQHRFPTTAPDWMKS